MKAALEAGVAIYNAGRYHAAHDAWEEHWLALAKGSEDERFLHGLIQFTAAIFHARNGNWSGAMGLADSAGSYLGPLPSDYQSVNLGVVKTWLQTLAADPEVIERRTPPILMIHNSALKPTNLDFEATLHASHVFAEADGYDEEVTDFASEYARADLADGVVSSSFVTLVFDFVREPDNRAIAFQRLTEHVRRRRSRTEDVDSLFD